MLYSSGRLLEELELGKQPSPQQHPSFKTTTQPELRGTVTRIINKTRRHHSYQPMQDDDDVEIEIEDTCDDDDDDDDNQDDKDEDQEQKNKG
ncbi:hypothetical protein BGZ65_013020, partial [Modicella reniformis]